MANLPELNEFTTGVYQIETSDPVLGGVDGITNVPLKALANRTKWLKGQVDELNTAIGSAIDAEYVQAELNKLPFKAPVAAVTTTNITLSGLQTVDGVSVTAGQRVLVAAQSTAAQNGIYTAQASAWVRSDDMNADAEIQAGVQVMVTGGSIYADTIWHLLTDGTITIGTTAQTWKCLTVDTAMLGTPTAPTAAQFDDDTTLATTAFVQRALGNASGFSGFTANATLTAAHAGTEIYASSTGGSITLTLPAASALKAGAQFRIFNTGVSDVIVSRVGADTIVVNNTTNSVTAVTLKAGDSIVLTSLGTGNLWYHGGGSAQLLYSGSLRTLAADIFRKADPATVVFTRTGSGTASIKAGTVVDVQGSLITFAAATNITMPALTAGTDYAIYACADGTVRADASFTAPTGYTTANSRKIGGFHYSPGGHSGSPGGGNSTAQINEYSFWDLKFRPACADPRGMALVAGSFWSDIYLLGVDHQINGSSKYAVTIADGSSPPKIPAKFGGNGSTAYGSLNWWEAAEVGQSFGKRLPAYDEFAALAYGTTENSSIGSDPGSTSWAAAYVSKWGVNQATGVLWTWGAEFSYRQDGSATPWAWRNNTGNRGQLYLYSDVALVASIFGGNWDYAAYSGSRASSWSNYPWVSSGDIGARLVCDHLSLD